MTSNSEPVPNYESFRRAFLDSCDSQFLPFVDRVDESIIFNGSFTGDDTEDTLAILLIIISASYRKILHLFEDAHHIQVFELASLGRLQLETYATLLWVMESPDKIPYRTHNFIELGYDMYRHLGNILEGEPQRTHSGRRLPSVNKRLGLINDMSLSLWYDELNYYAHPSPAFIMQIYSSRLQGMMNMAMFNATRIFASTIKKISHHRELDPQVLTDAIVSLDLINKLLRDNPAL